MTTALHPAPDRLPAPDRVTTRTRRPSLHAVPPAHRLSLDEQSTKKHIVAAARRLMRERGYANVSFLDVAQAAGVSPAGVAALFPTRMDLAFEVLEAPETLRGASRLGRLSGGEIVARYLRFWESGDNTAVLCGVLQAAAGDERVVRQLERSLTSALVRPLAWGLHRADAYPRIRLMMAHLRGLAWSRYVLREEPLASADHETLACWYGPALDGYLHGALGAG